MTDLTPQATETKTDFLSRPLFATLNIDWEKAIFISFLLIAILTRFWDLGGRVMSHDESLHTQFSYQFFNGDGYNHTPLMHGPFLFHITALSYWLFGDSDLAARIPVALFGILLVGMPYFLRRWIGKTGALFASFFLLISPYVTYYSRYIRHDVYVIVWALIVFFAIFYYLRERKENYLWWFAAGLALMFATKEVAFIYVAIFGSWLGLRLLVQIAPAPWLRNSIGQLKIPLAVTGIGILLLAGGLIGQRSVAKAELSAGTVEVTEGFAANPESDTAVAGQGPLNQAEQVFRWLQLAGVVVFGLGLFLAGNKVRSHLDAYPEFDLIVLFTTLVLPTVSPLFVKMAGWNPRDFTNVTCQLNGQETMSGIELFTGRFFNPSCWSIYLDSGLVHSGIFLLLTLGISVGLGFWWNQRRWLTIAVIFHAIFAFFFTSVFTNPTGWTSGMVSSLGYWLEQQGVQRGSQPWFYYFFVMPFYEFLPVLFSLLGIRLWLRKKRIEGLVGYWVNLLLLVGLTFSLSYWFFNRTAVQAGQDPSIAVAVILSLLVVTAGVLLWFLYRRKKLLDNLSLTNFSGVWQAEWMLEIMPAFIWWLLLTWIAYSYAGEKMPWLSIHFVIPMAFIAGWYFDERLRDVNWRDLLARPFIILVGLRITLIIAAFLTFGPFLLGKVQFGDQQLDSLNNVGQFLGGLVIFIGLLMLWRRQTHHVDLQVRRHSYPLALFGLLSLLTIRFTYMAAFPNADFTTEFLNYAHGAPATKDTVMKQVEELSKRLNGDKSLNVAFSQDVSWPFTWYLRDYPNRVYFGDSPSNSLNDSPIILVGSLDWAKVEPFLGNNYESHTYTYLWWPMEEYRKISWDSIIGTEIPGLPRRGLGNAQVRQALWDIFFYRDYTKYGEVFGGTYRPGEWPLRHELRLYIRKDVLATLWDYGLGAVNATGVEDPYADNEIALQPDMVINESGEAGTGPGQLFAPRNVAVGTDGRIYVADSGNHRIQVFDQEGQYLNGWGTFGAVAGQFNEPWGLAVDDAFVYVADTWNHRIQKFTLDGTFVSIFGSSGGPDGENDGLGLFFGPRDVLLLPDNRLLVTDTGNHRMQLLDRDGNFISLVGGFGNLLGQFNEPVGLAAGPDGAVYLADTWNGRVQRFSPDLVAAFEWPVHAWIGQSINNKPYAAADSAGRIFLTDPEGYRILIFSNFGDYVARMGKFGTDVNSLGLPNGIFIDDQDAVYIADSTNNRILKYPAPFGQSGQENSETGSRNGDDLDSMIENSDTSSNLDDPGNQPLEESGALPTPTTNS